MRRELDRLNALVREVAVESRDPATNEALTEVSRTLRGFLESTGDIEAAGTNAPLRVGARTWYDAASATSSIVAAWAPVLATDPTAKIALVSHGGDEGNRSLALRQTQDIAASVRDALVVAGARPDQVVAMGMGRMELVAGSDAPGIEVERLR